MSLFVKIGLLAEINQLELQADDPEERHIVTRVSWEQYEALVHRLGDRSGYRITYLEEALEIMSPSRRHEVSKKNIDIIQGSSEEGSKVWRPTSPINSTPSPMRVLLAIAPSTHTLKNGIYL